MDKGIHYQGRRWGGSDIYNVDANYNSYETGSASYDYDNEDQKTTKLIYQEDTFDKVRMSKINHMISWNKEIIV